METILPELFPNNSDFPIVQVLLATYNGEKYLGEFLESLLAQVGVRIHLMTSDDGSSDSTLLILEQYANRFCYFTQLEGPNKGPAANFFFLLEHADSNYVAFADQDDIWMPKHLLSSINRIRNLNVPALSFCAQMEFSNKQIVIRTWPRTNFLDHTFYSYVFQNPARGCTQVFNRELLEIAKEAPRNSAVMHDWWIVNLATLSGKVNFSNSAEIFYRLHSENFSSRVNRTKLIHLNRSFNNHISICLKQWSEISCFAKLKGSPTIKFIEIFSLKRLEFSRRVLFNWPKIRMNRIENILFKILIIKKQKKINKILWENPNFDQ